MTNAVVKSMASQDYFFIKRKRGELITIATQKVAATVNVMAACIRFASSLLIGVAIVCSLAFVDAQVAAMLLGVIGMPYIMLVGISRKRIRKNSLEINRYASEQVIAIEEMLRDIRSAIIKRTRE